MRKIGFEPMRDKLTDLQSAAFDRSATSSFNRSVRHAYLTGCICLHIWQLKVLVAQLVEHKTENLGVAGSSPV